MNGILCIRKLAYNWDISQASFGPTRRSGELFHIGANGT